MRMVPSDGFFWSTSYPVFLLPLCLVSPVIHPHEIDAVETEV